MTIAASVFFFLFSLLVQPESDDDSGTCPTANYARQSNVFSLMAKAGTEVKSVFVKDY